MRQNEPECHRILAQNERLGRVAARAAVGRRARRHSAGNARRARAANLSGMRGSDTVLSHIYSSGCKAPYSRNPKGSAKRTEAN